MKPASPALLALLATREFLMVDLITFTLAGPNVGTVLYYTTGPMDIWANGNHYLSGGQTGPYWDRKDNKAKGHQILSIQEDTLTIDCIPGTATILGSNTPLTTAMRLGVFDGAEMMVEHCFMPIGGYGDTSRGTVRWFVGRMANIDLGRSVATFTINSHLELLNLQFPRNLIQVPCPFNLGDASCGVELGSVDSYTVTFTNTSATITSTAPVLIGQPIYFTTTGGLPTNFAANTTYYVSPTGYVANTSFEVTAAYQGSPPIVAGSAGSGTQTVYFRQAGATYQTTGAVSATSTANVVKATISGSFAAGYFDLGTIEFTSGANDGYTISVKSCAFGTPDVITMTGYLPAAPAISDTFVITAGCDKTYGQPFNIQITTLSGGDNCDIVNGNYQAIQIGAAITGPGIPVSTTILTVSASGLYGLGSFTISNNATLSVSPSTPSAVTIAPPAPQNGCTKFANMARFGGYIFTPQPLAAI